MHLLCGISARGRAKVQVFFIGLRLHCGGGGLPPPSPPTSRLFPDLRDLLPILCIKQIPTFDHPFNSPPAPPPALQSSTEQMPKNFLGVTLR